MAKKKPTRPRNPQDATRRNVRAANTRLATLERRYQQLTRTVADLQARVRRLEARHSS